MGRVRIVIRKSGHGMSVTHTLDELVTSVDRVGDLLDEQAETVLEAVGIQVLSWVHQDYRTKARGGTDPAGIRWAPIKRESVAQRLRRLRSYRNASRQAKANQIDAAYVKHEIGVDTGRLINSLSYGTADPVDTLLEADARQVRIGSNVQYAGHFAKLRPIVSERTITEARAKELDQLVTDLIDEMIREELA